MDKGFKKFQKHYNKVNKANDKIIDKTLKRILKLKKMKMSDISTKNIYREQILVHKDTNNSEDTKKYLVKKMSSLQDQYPFVTINYDPIQQNTTTTKIKSINGNRIIITLNWQDYMRHAMASVPDREDSHSMVLPDLGLEKNFEEIKKKNWTIIQTSLNQILSSAQNHLTKEKTDHKVRLVHNTMFHEVTRNHFNTISQHIMRRYHGMVEMFNYTNNIIIIRVHWNIFLAQIAERDRRQRQIPLIVDRPFATKQPSSPFANKTHADHSQYIQKTAYPPTPVQKEKPKEEKPKARRRRKHSQPKIYTPGDLSTPLLQSGATPRANDMGYLTPLAPADDDGYYDALPSPPDTTPTYPHLQPAKDADVARAQERARAQAL